MNSTRNKSIGLSWKDALFTRRETEIVQLIARGLTNSEIASTLKIADVTVKFHITAIFRKSDVRNRSELIVKYHEAFPHARFEKAEREATLEEAIEELNNITLPTGVG